MLPLSLASTLRGFVRLATASQLGFWVDSERWWTCGTRSGCRLPRRPCLRGAAGSAAAGLRCGARHVSCGRRKRGIETVATDFDMFVGAALGIVAEVRCEEEIGSVGDLRRHRPIRGSERQA